MSINQVVRKFLDTHLHPDRPVLLAFSGGPDSTVLLDLLLSYRKSKPFPLHLAHVDHQWRPESTSEAYSLQCKALEMNIPFHLKQLDPQKISGNIENACRQMRIAFFKALCSELGFQAVLLGHHADDQAETVLKRVLEGASLESLRGLTPVSKMEGMVFWRPLLAVKKLDILDWAKCCSLEWIDDRSNADLRFLRNRMRAEILPNLSSSFGKEIVEPLVRFGAEAAELREYLDGRVMKFWKHLVKSPRGVFIDLQEAVSTNEISKLEIKFLLRKAARSLGVTPAHSVVERLASALEKNTSNYYLYYAGLHWIADRSRLFISSAPAEMFTSDKLLIINGMEQCIGGWSVSAVIKDAQLSPETDCVRASAWQDCWAGKMSVCLPPGEYYLGPPCLSSSYLGKSSLSKWLTNHKVPSFMRRAFPVVWRGDQIVHEFLTGKKSLFPSSLQTLCIEICSQNANRLAEISPLD